MNFEEENQRKQRQSAKEQLELDLLIITLKKAGSDKTQEELSRLVPLIRRVKYFRNLELKYDEYKDICLYLKYLFAPKGEWIIEYGTVGSRFYVILEGETCIYIPGREKHSEHDESVCPYILQERWLSMPEQQIHIKELQKGSSFGELALINDEPRAATVVCKTNCHFAYLEKSDYQTLLRQIYEKSIETEISYFHALPYFRSWTRKSLHKLLVLFDHKQLVRGQTLCRDGDPAKFIYIVKEGELELWIKREIKEAEKEVNINNYVGPRTKYKSDQIKDFNLAENPLKTIIKSRQYENIKLCQLGLGKLIGIEDAVQDGNYTYTVICASATATLLSISIHKFNNTIKCHEKSWKYIENYITESNAQRVSRLETINEVRSLRENIERKLLNLGKSNKFQEKGFNGVREQINIIPKRVFMSPQSSPLETGRSDLYWKRKASGDNINGSIVRGEENMNLEIFPIERYFSIKDKDCKDSERNNLPGMNTQRSVIFNQNIKDANHNSAPNIWNNLNIQQTMQITQKPDNLTGRLFNMTERSQSTYLRPSNEGSPCLEPPTSESKFADLGYKEAVHDLIEDQIQERISQKIIKSLKLREKQAKQSIKMAMTQGGNTQHFSSLKEGGDRLEFMTNRKRSPHKLRSLNCQMTPNIRDIQPPIPRAGESPNPRRTLSRWKGLNSYQNYHDGDCHRSKSVHNRETYMPPYTRNIMRSTLQQNRQSVQQYVSRMNTQLFNRKANKTKQYFMPLAYTLKSKF